MYTIHDIPGPTLATVVDPEHCMHSTRAQYNTVLYCTVRIDSQNFTLKSSTALCTVTLRSREPAPRCAVMVVVTHAECWAAVAEWMMFDTELSDTNGLSSAYFFSVSCSERISKPIGRGFQCQGHPERPLLSVEHEAEKKRQSFFFLCSAADYVFGQIERKDAQDYCTVAAWCKVQNWPSRG